MSKTTAGQRARGTPLTVINLLLLATLSALLAIMLLAAGVPASAHENEVDSVDSTKSIHYRDYQRYDDARSFAVSAWNNLNVGEGGSDVSIRADTDSTSADLDFHDYYADDGRTGYYTTSPSPDRIYFNERNMNTKDTFNKRTVATHELGHALRLEHPSGSSDSEYWRTRSVMYKCSTCTPFNTPQEHDRNDYYAYW